MRTNKKILTAGNDSSKNNATNIKSKTARNNANSAGIVNQASVRFLAHTAKIAPIIGPIMNPKEKAIPTKACTHHIYITI